MLHDVKIELYGEDGSRVDRIEGDEFEYDQKAGMAKAAGPVEITLMRPGWRRPLRPRQPPGQAAGQQAESRPAGPAAQAAARGEIHVKTSGLTFDQNSGVATTEQRVDFSMAQGSGSSMGATFDSQQGQLVLDHAVELTALRGAATVQIACPACGVRARRPAVPAARGHGEYQGGQAAAGERKILFRDDGSAARLDATNGFTLTTATAATWQRLPDQMDFDEQNQPRHGRLEGGVTMDSVSESGAGNGRAGGSCMAARRPPISISTRRASCAMRTWSGAWQWTARSRARRRASRSGCSRHWRSPVADVEFRDSGPGAD